MDSPLDSLINALSLKINPGEEESKLLTQLRQARKTMPESVVLGVMQRINSMLPQAEKRYGAGSDTYLFYIDLLIVCFWAARYKAMAEQCAMMADNLRLENTILRERTQKAERRLLSYETAEDMLISGTLDAYAKNILARVKEALPDHPRVAAFGTAFETIEKTHDGRA